MSEFIYILENPSFAGVIKIGKTAREVSVRVRELSSATGVPTEFTVFKQFAVEDATISERQIHDRLAEYRVSDNREFFRLSADDAALIIEEMLRVDMRTRSNPEREDDLFFAATDIAISLGKIWPGVLAGRLQISHVEAEGLVRGLQARGIVNGQFALCADLRAEHVKRQREERDKRRLKEATAYARAQTHVQQIEQVKDAIAGLVDPATGKGAEVSFHDDNGNLVVAVHGSEQLRLEVEKRLSALPDQPQETEESSDVVEPLRQMPELPIHSQDATRQTQPRRYWAGIVVACLLIAPIAIFLLLAANDNRKHSSQIAEAAPEPGDTLSATNANGDLTNALPTKNSR